MTAWFVVRSATRQEKRARDALSEAGFVVYLPTVTKWYRLGREKTRTMVQRPFLDGYMFVQIPEGAFATIESTDAVHAVVRYTDNAGNRAPRSIPQRVIDDVEAILATGEFDDKAPAETVIGTTVRITDGPFADLIGKVKAVKRNGRLMVLLDALQRGAPVRPVEVAEDRLEVAA